MTSAIFSLVGVCPRVTPLTIAITVPFVLTLSGGGITSAVRTPSFAKSSKSTGAWHTDDGLHIASLQREANLVHDVGTDIAMMENGDAVPLDLADLLLCQAEIRPDDRASDIRRIGGDS